VTEPTSYDEAISLGRIFPTAWVGAVLRVDLAQARIDAFCGTATLLGEELFLTAEHVLNDALSEPRTAALVLLDPKTGIRRVTAIQAHEGHPQQGVDLAIGKFAWVEGTGDPLDIPAPFAGWSLPSGWVDVKTLGFPDELVRPTEGRPIGRSPYRVRQSRRSRRQA
jgi:hypothetical protein